MLSTFTGFSARHLNQHRDPVTVIMVQAYNDWHIDEWAGAYPGPLHPDCSDADLESRGDVRRNPPARGERLPRVTMPELPHFGGLPSYHDEDYWGLVFRRCRKQVW